jgi:hypothetical protein
MAGAYQRNVGNPNSGKRGVKHAFRQPQGGTSGPCISYRDGKKYVFEPKTKTVNKKRVIVVKEQPVSKRTQFTRAATYGETWQSGQ